MSHGFMSNSSVSKKRRIEQPNALEKVAINLLNQSKKPILARPWGRVARVNAKKNTQLKNLLTKYLNTEDACRTC